MSDDEIKQTINRISFAIYQLRNEKTDRETKLMYAEEMQWRVAALIKHYKVPE